MLGIQTIRKRAKKFSDKCTHEYTKASMEKIKELRIWLLKDLKK